MSIRQASDWETSLVAAITDELDQLKHLVEDKSGSTEKGDIQAQLDRLCGLTDLAHNEQIPFTEPARLQIRELNGMAMGMVEHRSTSPHQVMSVYRASSAKPHGVFSMRLRSISPT